MKNTTLVFPSFTALWEFKCNCPVFNCMINSAQLSLTAELSESQIQDAIDTYKAMVPEDNLPCQTG